MTAPEDGSLFVASNAGDASMLRVTVVGTGRQDSGLTLPSSFRIWARLLRTFDCMLVQPLKRWIRLDRDASVLDRWDDRELQDIGINRLDIAAIRAGTYKRTSSVNVEPTGSPTARWDERPPQIFI